MDPEPHEKSVGPQRGFWTGKSLEAAWYERDQLYGRTRAGRMGMSIEARQSILAWRKREAEGLDEPERSRLLGILHLWSTPD